MPNQFQEDEIPLAVMASRMKKFGENIPTGSISPEVIDVHTLNFKPNFKFSRLNFFFWGGTPVPLGCALVSLGKSLACVKISGRSPP